MASASGRKQTPDWEPGQSVPPSWKAGGAERLAVHRKNFAALFLPRQWTVIVPAENGVQLIMVAMVRQLLL